MNHRWLFRMAKWVHAPPSESRVKFVLGIAALCLALFAVEYFIGWPEALSIDPKGHKFDLPEE